MYICMHIYIYVCIWGALTLALATLSSIGLGTLPQGAPQSAPDMCMCFNAPGPFVV